MFQSISAFHVILVLTLQTHFQPIACANCTANCVNVRREWPQLDFEFYYEPTRGPLQSSLLSYSVLPTIALSTSPLYTTPSFSLTSSSTLPSATSSLTVSVSPSIQIAGLPAVSPTSAHIRPTQTLPSASPNVVNCSDQMHATANLSKSREETLQNYLLRTVLLKPNDTVLPHNLSVHLQENLTSVYEYAFDKQREHLHDKPTTRRLLSTENDSLNLTVWRLQVDNSLQIIDVIYYLQRDDILVPFEDAAKVLTFVSNDFIRNRTGYEVLHKVRRYNEEWANERVATLDWLNWASLMGLILVLLLCVVLFVFVYIKYRNERRRWLDSINRELNRVTPTHSQTEESDRSHWNYGMEREERDGDSDQEHHYRSSTSTSNKDKIDKSSQYNYPQTRTTSTSSPNRTLSATFRERLIPLGRATDQSSDYDRISYVKTHETMQETKKHPNILEIQLSKETQSIVQEIRKELNRYNFKKIISQEDNTTSEA